MRRSLSMAVAAGRRLMPSAAVRGMTELDKEMFRLDTSLPCLLVPAKEIGRVLGIPLLKQSVVQKMHGLKAVLDSEERSSLYDCQMKKILFDPEQFTQEKQEEILGKVASVGVEDARFSEHAVSLSFDDWNAKRCLDAVLPEHLRFSGFSEIGHIVHCTLSPDLLPYKRVIGEILLAKVKACETVVNKTGNLETEFRELPLELIAGKDDYITEVKEGGCRFRLDFSKVFWNPRLGTEHGRLVDQFANGSLVYDVCAGIGPFAIPAGRRGQVSAVLANDLNPTAVDYLRENIRLNKVEQKVSAFEMDGRHFIRTVVAEDLQSRNDQNQSISAAHLILNLPGIAYTFLPAFQGFLRRPLRFPITVHCYLFSKAADPQAEAAFFVEDAKRRVRDTLQRPELPIAHVHRVRNVAPMKEQMCVSFDLPEDVYVGDGREENSDDLNVDDNIVGGGDQSSSVNGEPTVKRTKL